MIAYTTIATDDESYSLSALISKNGYIAPSLSIFEDGHELECWDNVDYLIVELYHYLNTGEGDEFNYYFHDVREDVLAVFNKAISLGFFVNTNNNK